MSRGEFQLRMGLTRSPGRIFRVEKLDDTAPGCDDSVTNPNCWGAPTEIVSLSGFEPTGFTFAPPIGDFLISTWDGLPFTNASRAEELERMRTGLSEMLVTDISQSRYVRPPTRWASHESLRRARPQ